MLLLLLLLLLHLHVIEELTGDLLDLQASRLGDERGLFAMVLDCCSCCCCYCFWGLFCY